MKIQRDGGIWLGPPGDGASLPKPINGNKTETSRKGHIP